jgi:predicted DNA-binding transcriptional regulator AlpA
MSARPLSESISESAGSRKLDARASTSAALDPGRLLSAREAAAFLGMSLSWVYQSDVPHSHLGRRRLYRRQDLDDYVARRLSHSVTEERR